MCGYIGNALYEQVSTSQLVQHQLHLCWYNIEQTITATDIIQYNCPEIWNNDCQGQNVTFLTETSQWTWLTELIQHLSNTVVMGVICHDYHGLLTFILSQPSVSPVLMLQEIFCAVWIPKSKMVTYQLIVTLKAVVPMVNSRVMMKRKMKVMAVFPMLSSFGVQVVTNGHSTSTVFNPRKNPHPHSTTARETDQ